MKKYLCMFLGIFCTLLQIQAQDTIANKGIHFEDIPLKEALAKAQAENKKVFVDCYTQTCGPCKYMMKNIFPLQECGDYFNPRFISLARDMNVGEGPEMGKKYEVGIYPTFLIINPDGSLYSKEIGAVRVNSKITFVEKMKRALERTELAAKYAAGDRDIQLIRRYVELLKGSGNQQADKVVNDFLAPMSVNELCQEANWKMLQAEVNSPASPVFRKLLDNRKDFEQLLGKGEVEGKLITTYQNEFDMYKMMDMDFSKRIADLKKLENDGCQQAATLSKCMTLRWIINEKLTSRMGEIITILQQLKAQPTDDALAIIKELSSFERVANVTQRAKACAALRNIQKETKNEGAAAEISKAITRISPNK